ncbi:MAG: TraU family protein [Parahaliea sp.]
MLRPADTPPNAVKYRPSGFEAQSRSVRRLIVGELVLLLVAIVVLLGLLANRVDAQAVPVGRADSVTSMELIKHGSTDMACFDYEVAGGCLWMTCTTFGCEFDYSLRIEHNLPEVIVEAYPHLGRGPWVNGRRMSEPTSFAQDGGSTTEGGAVERETALRFKNVNITGSPAILTYHLLSEMDSDPPLSCTPLTYPTAPHYLSHNDPMWRSASSQTLLALANPSNAIGKGMSHFAYMFPRIGFVKQGHDYKASLVAALRAYDFTRRETAPHVYIPLNMYEQSKQGYWPPQENADQLWQQVVPFEEEEEGGSGAENEGNEGEEEYEYTASQAQCKKLPDIDDSTAINDPYNGRLNEVYGNAWHVWRRYSCCEPAGAVLIAYF